MAVAVLCRLIWALLLLCLPTRGRPSTASAAKEVPKPFNLTVNSYNLNTTLHWDYNSMDVAPSFFVENLNKIKNNWIVIETCQNISHRFCDLSYEIIDPLSYYKVRVFAFVGSESSSAASIEFSLSTVGILGPPKLKVNIEEKIIVIDIFHPEVPLTDEIDSILENGKLHYIVYSGNDTEEVTDCDSAGCTAEFSISHEGTYCFSAQGISNHFLGMTMEKSKESCVTIEEGISKQTLGIIIGVVVGFLAIVAISCFIIIRWTIAKNLMPQSLSSVVRNIVSYVQMPAPQITKYDNVATSPIDSLIEEIPCMDQKVKIDSDVSADFGSKESTDPGYQSSLTDNEQKTDEGGDDQSNSNSYFHTDSSTSGDNSRVPSVSTQDEKILEHAPEQLDKRGDSQSNSSSYFHTDSSTSGISARDTSESEKDEQIPEPAAEPTKDIKPRNFGYDKPHFPKELI